MLTFGSLFSGCGGLDLGFKQAGMKCVWQFEINKIARKVLKQHFKSKLYGDVKEALHINLETVNVICGGDPCSCRSKAKGNRKSVHPDLSGYFLAVVGKMRPWWVVRENVPASDDKEFAICLELLGYGTIIIRTNSYTISGQYRTRDFIVGCTEKTRMRKFIELSIRKSNNWNIAEKYKKERSLSLSFYE